MQLKDIVWRLETASEEERLQFVQAVRRRRTIERPAAKAREERTERKVSRGKMSAMDKLVSGLSSTEVEQLILKLGGEDGEVQGPS